MSHAYLIRHGLYRSLWLARTISFFGDTVATTALILYTYEVNSAGTAVGLLLLAQALPRLVGPFAGSLADRWDQRKLMVGCDLGQFLLFGIIVFLRPPFPVLLLY
jgi:MFS family permease